ncbi:uncharacterized protein LOC123500712 [Portunus trituberculatus]|uniref:uncharacterized protein LOC123500712 n=1 Tax=Portunus trituberculatus TaxID=210409 RepID=UPI001E1CB622|nr:uncharacterized protein LOC123500712 [Portunus trituberculatus]
MGRQVSTAVSDLALAASAVWGFRALSLLVGIDRRFGKWWFMLQTLAATLGTVRFGQLMPSYQSSVERYHKNFSWLCRAIGVPCLAAEVCIMTGHNTPGQGFLVLAVACFVASSIKSRHKDKMVELVNVLSVLTIIGLAVAGGRIMFVWAGALFVTSALVGAEGEVFGVQRVDVFHYLLVGVNYFLVEGFRGPSVAAS